MALGLLALAITPYLQTLRFEFVSWDDPVNVADNPHLQAGLSWPGVVWAFTTFQSGYWHPLTWLSHMIDISIWGIWAGGHHLSNLALHATNTLLLFVFLTRLTIPTGAASIWRGALVAALFAVHPLHAESVSWISDRTDVLSASFALLALWSYAGYAQDPSLRHYLLVTGFFVLGLMTKSVLIVLPFVFLLLDFWPLGRPIDQRLEVRSRRSTVGRLVREKIPWFLLSVAFAVFGAVSQRTVWTASGYAVFPFPVRIENAVVAYGRYLDKLFVPINLAFFYPHPIHWPIARVILSCFILAAITAITLWSCRSRPWLLVGWLWFVGTLVPVIGLVHVGWQSIADRYTYLSAVGIFIALVWSIPQHFVERFPRAAATAALGLLALLTAMTSVQASHWKNSRALFAHAAQVTTGNFLADQDLGNILEKEGDLDGALQLYRKAEGARPSYAKIDIHENIANVLIQKGRYVEAAAELKTAIEINPKSSAGYNSLGSIKLMANEYEEAAKYLQRAVDLEPANAAAGINYGTALVKLGRWNEAIAELEPITQSDPRRFVARTNLALALAGHGEVDRAIGELREVLKIAPEYSPARHALEDLKSQHKF